MLAIAEEITKLLAICVRCGNPAVHTQRLVESEELVMEMESSKRTLEAKLGAPVRHFSYPNPILEPHFVG